MKFDRAKNLVKLLLAFCVVLCVIGIVTAETGSMTPVYASIASFVCFVLSFVVVAVYCKCPYCGKRVYLGLFKATHCPHCRRNFETGVKKKGKR